MKSDNKIERDLITIGITSYNSQETISNAIYSAINQSWINKEIIIIDDNSKDKCWETIKYFKKYKNIRVFRNTENKGVAYSRNFIIKNAKGEYIAFFDDDDISHKNRLHLQYLNLKIYKNFHKIDKPIFCYSKTKKKFNNKNSIIFYPPGLEISKNIVSGKKVAEFLLTGNQKKFYSGYYVTCSLMAKTKDFIYCNGFDDKFRRCEDTEFAIRSSLKDSHFIGVNKILVFQNMSYKKYKTHSIELDYILKIFEKHINLFKSKKEYKFEIFWNILKYKILEKNFLNATIIFLKLFRMDLIHLVKKLFLISNTLKQNLFIFKNYDDNLR